MLPTGDMNAYAQLVAHGIIIFNGFIEIFSDSFITTWNKMLAVADVRMNSITKFDTIDMNAINAGTGNRLQLIHDNSRG